ncbi:hypothetical protein [Klebsiella phage 05F01]|nr:hypothetical protein [Klebsiella phage 05F01]
MITTIQHTRKSASKIFSDLSFRISIFSCRSFHILKNFC